MIDVPDWCGYLRFREQFQQTLDERYFPIEWLDQQVISGRAIMFRSDNSAILVELRRYPGGALDIHGLIAAGEKAEIIDVLIPEAEAWAREKGCTAAAIESRAGWQRAMKTSGYEPHQITVRKEL